MCVCCNIMQKRMVCAFCKSKWTYATKGEFVCRKCGRRIAREEEYEDKDKEYKSITEN